MLLLIILCLLVTVILSHDIKTRCLTKVCGDVRFLLQLCEVIKQTKGQRWSYCLADGTEFCNTSVECLYMGWLLPGGCGLSPASHWIVILPDVGGILLTTA